MAETLVSPGYLARENDISFRQPAPAEIATAFIGPTVKGEVEVPTVITSYNEYQRKFGTTFESGSNKYEYLTSLAVKSFFSQGGSTALVTRVASGSFTSADSTYISASVVQSQPFTLGTLGTGELFNNAESLTTLNENSDGSLVLGSADNIRWEISDINTARGTFSLLVRRGDDSTKSKILMEVFNDLSLDPNSDNYIEKVIGTQYHTKTVDEDGNVYVTKVGDYPNRSNYIRVTAVNTPTPNYLGTDGITVGVDSDLVSYSGSLPIAQTGAFYNGQGTLYQAGRVGNFFDNIDDVDTQGLQASDYQDAISILSNKEYRYNVIVTPGLIYDLSSHKTQLDSLISVIESRGDAILVMDLEQYGSSVSNVVAASAGVNSSYTSTYWPWVKMKSDTGKDVWVPASTAIAGVYAFSDASSAPWYAPAGLIRGGITTIVDVERKILTTDRNKLYQANINPIAAFPGQGIAIYGQKTLQKKQSLLNRVNIRRLLIEIKEEIGKQAQFVLFEQNSVATRNKFLAKIRPYLESIVQREGLYTYDVEIDETLNTGDVIDRNQLIGKITLYPTSAIEFVIMDFVIEPSGVRFSA